MAVIGYIQTGVGWYGAAPDSWENVFTIDDTDTSFSISNFTIGLSWRKMGTTGGAPSDFSAHEVIRSNITGNISVSGNNTMTINSVTLSPYQASYDVTQPGTNVVGATFTFRYDPSSTTLRTHTKADNEAVGSSFNSGMSGNYYPSGFVVAPSTTSGHDALLYVHESATGTIGRRHWRVVNLLPPDYRPGQIRIAGVWQSHNRSGGNADKRASGSWATMRTQTGTGNPPLIRKSGSWVNQAKIGANS